MMMVFAVTFALIIIGQIFLFKRPREAAAEDQLRLNPRRPAPRHQPNPQPRARQRSSLPGQAQTDCQSCRNSGEHKAASSEVETVVENDLYRIVFTNQARKPSRGC